MDPRLKKGIIIGFAIGIPFAIFLFLAMFSYDTNQKKSQLYKVNLEKTLTAYGDSIDHIHVDDGYVTVYVNTKRWKLSDDSTKKQFAQEMASIMKSEALKVGIKPQLLTIYTADRQRVGMFEVK